MGYWQRRKLAKLLIIAALVIAAVWGVRELLRPDAQLVTVKYVEDLETFQAVKVAGGYTRAVTTRDKKLVNEWIDLMLAVEKGEKVASGKLDQPFPCYIVEYRLGKNVWVAMMQVTEDRAGRSYQFFGDDVFQLDPAKDLFRRTGELMARTEAAEKGKS